MKKITYTVTDELGIHARPAGMMAKEAKKYTSKIALSAKGKEADLTRLMAVMGMGIKKGDEIVIVADGEDESEAISAFEKILKDTL